MKKKRSIAVIFEDEVRRIFAESSVKRAIVGVSGGADSVALLYLAMASGIEVKVVHCNFHLRGEESMRDQRHVEEICRKLGATLEIVDFDVNAYRDHKSVSVEMACRDLRYDYFRKLLHDEGYDRVLIGHNSDDNIETLFLNLFRGSGVAGLKGISPDTGEIMRPMLSYSRKEIESYLEEKGADYITDSSNLQSDYRRNYIRNEILPMIEKRWPGVRRSIITTLENLRSEDEVLRWAEKEIIDNDEFLSLQTINKSPNPFWTIYKFGSRHGATRDIAVEITDVYNKKAGSQTIVGKGWTAGNGKLIFTMKGLKYTEI